MKRFRLLGYAAAALVALVVVASIVAFSSSFQTWAARRALAARPDWRGSIGAVDAGWRHATARDVRLEHGGMVVTLPAVEADLPVYSALFSERVLVSRLVAKGWTLDLSRTANPSSVATVASPAAPEVTEVARVFAGVFSQLGLPVELTLDGVELEGEVILPAMRGRVKISLRGGGLGAGREGKFELNGRAALRDKAVDTLEAKGDVTVAMDTARSFSRVSGHIGAQASGTQFPAGVTLVMDVAAARAAAGESYSAIVRTGERPLIEVHVDWPSAGKRLSGTWKLDVRDLDVAPFALGQPLPTFALAGEGRFETAVDFSGMQSSGRLKAAVSRLEALYAPLSEIGPVTLDADFDLSRRGEAIAVSKLDAQLGAAKPVARVQAVQTFEFNPRTRELLASEPSRDLASVTLEGMPVAWARRFLRPALKIGGTEVRGRFVVAARGGGMTLRSETPLAIGDVSLATAAGALLANVDLSTNVSADYTPDGWQVELAGLSASSRGTDWLRLDAKLGQLAGRDQPIKATGTAALELSGLIAQPVARDRVALTRGHAAVDFAASVASKSELRAKVTLTDLAGGARENAATLPAVALEVRADVAPDRQLELNVPLVITLGERRSDLTIAGTIGEKEKHRTIIARLSGSKVFVEDLQALAALADAPARAKAEAPAKTAPAWANLAGTLALQIGRVVYSNMFEATGVTGTVRLEAGALKLELVRAGLGEAGEAKLTGVVNFEPDAPQPYALAADVAVTELEVGPLLRGIFPGQAPIVEGRFALNSQIAGRAESVGALMRGASGDLRLTSRGGTFRGLPLNVSHLVENQSKIAGWIASASATISSLAGKRDENDVANKVQAASELAKGLYPLPYDQLSVVISRDAALNAQLKDFSLISPEVRLTGSGRTTHRQDAGLLSDALAMDFTLRAQGRPAQMLKYLGALEAQKDDLGYAACTLPIKISGTIGKPDGTELSNRVVALVLEKSGFIDKAMELFGKSRGKQASAAPDPR